MSVTRRFGTDLRFRSDGEGRWVIDQISATGQRLWFTSTAPGSIGCGPFFYIERRRAEPGHAAGWYYFGPGAPDGERAGEYIEDAARLAAKHLGVDR
jgi:hypothetical protein